MSGVLVLHKTLDILEILRERDAGCTLADVARASELPKATVYRILATLEQRGYLDRGPDGEYRLARKMFDLERRDALEETLLRAARPLIGVLVASCRETVNLGILDAGEVVVIHTVESPLTVRMSSKVGNRRHLHSTALGKVLLAALPEKEAMRLVRMKGLTRLTGNTIATQPALLAELRRVRRRGWAIDNQENETDGRCIGAPIAGPHEAVVAALSISGPEFRMDMARAKALAPELKRACARISEAMRAR
ncbi:MAG TPA: IclR family transcriptional regulator [Bryobacteraceae bacterium]|nr:IclR family transcriptional regulator [Bryobacteraceae bacterium]